MARNVFANITQKGTESDFHQALELQPNIWENHVMRIDSTAASEQLVWPGFLPEPREFINGRNLVGIRDFTYTVTNKTYELSFMIDRESMEDDQHSMINMRISEGAEVWAGFKDSQFATLLINGESATLGIDTLDSSAFHLATRTIGASGTIDNTDTAAISSDNDPTLAQCQTAIKGIITKMDRFLDDTGDRPFNAGARSQKRLVIPTEYVRRFRETVNAALVGGGDSNPYFENICELDELLYLTDADNAVYMSYVGSTRKPFIYQERTPLEIIVRNEPGEVAENDGVLVLCRQRYRLGYGDPRRNLRYDFT
jgi:phage major head subunit gpT-like protein